MAHSLGLAEGVETSAQVQSLHHHGCDKIQGYLLSRPLDAYKCLAFLGAWSADASTAAEMVVSSIDVA